MISWLYLTHQVPKQFMDESVVALPTKEDFKGAIGSTFHVSRIDGDGFELVLESVKEHVSSNVQENFSLKFRTDPDAAPMQNTYRLVHAGLGEMDLFLVPIKRDAEGLYYEAVFNLLKR